MATSSPACTGDTNVSLHGEPPTKRVRMSVPPTGQGHHREIGLMRWRSEEDAASFIGSASGIHFIRSVYSAVEAEKSRAASPIESSEQNLVPGEDDQLPETGAEPTPKTLWQGFEISVHPDDEITQVSFSDLLGWSQSYFDDWHPAYPFLHAPAILTTFRRISQSSLSQLKDIATLDLVIVRAILSIALADRRQWTQRSATRSVPASLVFPSFDAAIDSVQETLTAATTIRALQAVVSVQLFLISMLRHNAASRLGGLIVRMAFQIGLHRCPVRYTSFSAEDIQIRKRVFWTIYCIDRHLSQSLGLPLAIRDDDIDVCYLNEERHAGKLGVDLEMDDRLTLLQFLVRHAEIKGLTMELCNKSIQHRQADPDATTSIIAKTKKWRNDIETFLDTATDPVSALSGYHQITLLVLQHECTISLNRPFLAMPKDTADYKAALQSCISAARSVVSHLQKYLSRFRQALRAQTGAAASIPSPLLWPSFTWAVWQSAFILLYATIEGELPKVNAIKLIEHSVNILKHIALRGGVWPNACAAAIRDLRRHLDKPPRTARSDEKQTQQQDSPIVSANGVGGKTAATDRLSTLAGAAEQHGRPAPIRMGEASTTEFSLDVGEGYNGLVGSRHTSNADSSSVPPQMHHSFAVPITPSGSGFGLEYGAPYNPDLRTAINLSQNPPSAATFTSDAIFDLNNPELFNGFDIPFWLDDGQYDALLNDSSGAGI